MAIAEAEPKKSEVAVTSAGVSDGTKDKVLKRGKSFVNNKGYSSSSPSTSVGIVKKYNLYDNIKGFRFEMPDGWSDEDIALFVTCCLEKEDDFSKANTDKTQIWECIAQSGAKKSGNPLLFTINSCLELAECIRKYLSKNISIFSDNDSFMNFHSDVKSLLPYFSDSFLTNKKVSENEAMNESSSELLSNDVIQDLVIKNAADIRNGNPNVWNAITSELEERLGIKTDPKDLFECEKGKIISDVIAMEEKGINKKDAFIDRAREFIEVFDYINPKNIRVSNYLTVSVDSTIDSFVNIKDNTATEIRNYSCDDLIGNEMDHKSIESSRCEYGTGETETKKKGKRGRPRGRKSKSKLDESNDFSEDNIYSSPVTSAKPSSTTPDDMLRMQKSEKQNITVLDGENKEFITKSADSTEDSDATVTSPNKSPGRGKKERFIPKRTLPSRSARDKVISYSLSSYRSRLYKDTTESSKNAAAGLDHKRSNQFSFGIDKDKAKNRPSFKGFDPDYEDTTDRSNELKRIRNAMATTLSQKIVNPDTTTDFSNESISKNLGEVELPYMKRVSRKRKDIETEKQRERGSNEDLGPKVRKLHANSPMKNLVVKLFDCKHVPSIMDHPRNGSIISLPKKTEKSSPFSSGLLERNEDDRLIEETAVLAKDVVDSEYNPNSDSAKLVSDERFNKIQQSSLTNEGKKVTGAAGILLAATSLQDSQYSKNAELTSSSNHLVNRFCGLPHNKLSKGSTSAPVDSASSSSDCVPVGNRPLNFASACSKFQETVSPYSSSAGTSSSEGRPSTSSDILSSLNSESEIETAVAKLKKGESDYFNQDGSYSCDPARFAAFAMPEWFERFVIDQRRHESIRMQQLVKMQQELANVELKKVSLLEKIFGVLHKM